MRLLGSDGKIVGSVDLPVGRILSVPGLTGATGATGPTGPAGTTTWAGLTGVPSNLAYTDTTQTLTNKTLTNPKINTINDSTYDTNVLQTLGVSGATNYLQLQNSTGSVSLAAIGGSTDIGVNLFTKAAGTFFIRSGSNGYIAGFNAPASSVNYVYTSAAATGSGPEIYATGSDSNVDLNLRARNYGSVQLKGAGGTSFRAYAPASSVNYVQVNSSATGVAPELWARGSDTNIGLNLATSGTGVVTANGAPVVTTTGAQTLTNKTLTAPTLTSPKINAIYDVNGAPVVSMPATASAVNYLLAQNNVTGDGPFISAAGADSSVSLNLASKGSGHVYLKVNGSVALDTWSPASAVNYLAAVGATTGTDPYLQALGSDANIDVNLIPKGTGAVTANSVPVVTTTGAQTLTNKTLTSPKITSILDANGNKYFEIAPQASAVNYVQAVNGAAGSSAYFQAAGADANLNIGLWSKGTGQVMANNVPVVTTTGTQSLTNKTITTPTITSPKINQIQDSNGNTILNTSVAASAVNYLSVANNVTGAPPYVFSSGSDTNIGLSLYAKGTGSVTLLNTSGGTAFVASAVTSAVNYFGVVSAATGNGPGLFALGTDTNINATLWSKGSGQVGLVSNNANALVAYNPASAVNYVSVSGSATGNSPYLLATGADANIALSLYAKGGSGVGLYNSNGVALTASAPASSVNYVQVTGAATAGAPQILASGTDANIDLKLVPKGTGSVAIGSVGYAAVRVAVPATATSTGVLNQIAVDGSYLYVCVAANTWRRTALSTW